MIVLGSPFMGQLQSFLRRSLSTRNYVLLFGVGVVVAVTAAIVLAVTRIRERRALRFGLMAIALLFGGTYMWWTRCRTRRSTPSSGFTSSSTA